MAALAASTGGRLAWLDSGLPRFAPLPMGQALTQGQSRDLGPWLLIPWRCWRGSAPTGCW